MQIDLTLKNYRCFPDESPARVSLKQPFTALIGVNNSGKSSLLKFFYEFRALFSMLNAPSGNLLNALNGGPQGFGQAASIRDPVEIFSKLNDRAIGIALSVNGNRPTGEPVTITLDI